ncbi:hypothetical protein ACFO9Q_21610 [Paenibacillus sp. GCM10023252]
MDTSTACLRGRWYGEQGATMRSKETQAAPQPQLEEEGAELEQMQEAPCKEVSPA